VLLDSTVLLPTAMMMVLHISAPHKMAVPKKEILVAMESYVTGDWLALLMIIKALLAQGRLLWLPKVIPVAKDLNAFMAPPAYLMISKIGLVKKLSHLHVKAKLAVRILTVILVFNALNLPMAAIKSVRLQLRLHRKGSHVTRIPDVIGDYAVFTMLITAVEMSV